MSDPLATFPVGRNTFIGGRSVVLALRSRGVRESRWRWLLEMVGW